MKNVNRLVLSAAMLLASVWVAPGAFAEAPVRSETVKFYDLNVDTPAGAQALYSRIHAAARRVCEETDPLLRLGATVCAKKAEARAIETLGLPQLTAYYQEKTGNRQQPLVTQR